MMGHPRMMHATQPNCIQSSTSSGFPRSQLLHFNPSNQPNNSRYHVQIGPQYQGQPPPLMQQPQLQQQQVQVYQYNVQVQSSVSNNPPHGHYRMMNTTQPNCIQSSTTSGYPRSQLLHFNPSSQPKNSRYHVQIGPQYQGQPPPLMQQPPLQQQVQVYQYNVQHQPHQFQSSHLQPMQMQLPQSSSCTSVYFQNDHPQYQQQCSTRFPPCIGNGPSSGVQNSHSSFSLLSQYSNNSNGPSVSSARHSDRQFLDNYSSNSSNKTEDFRRTASEHEIPSPSPAPVLNTCQSLQPYRTPMAMLLLSQVQECMKDEVVSKKSLKNIPGELREGESGVDNRDGQSYYERHDPYKQGGIYVGKNGEVFYSVQGTSERVRYEEANEVEPLEVGFVACEPDPPFPEDPDSLRFWNGFINLSEIANQKLLDFIASSLEHDDKWDMFTHLEIILKHGGVASTMESIYLDFESHYSSTDFMVLFFEFLSGIFTPYSPCLWTPPSECEDPLILEIEYDVANIDRILFHCINAEEATEEAINLVTLLRQTYLEEVRLETQELVVPVEGLTKLPLVEIPNRTSRFSLPEIKISLQEQVKQEVPSTDQEELASDEDKPLQEDSSGPGLLEIVEINTEDDSIERLSETFDKDEDTAAPLTTEVNSDGSEIPEEEKSVEKEATTTKERKLEPWELKVKELLGGYAEPVDWETEQDVMFPKRHSSEPSVLNGTTGLDGPEWSTRYLQKEASSSNAEISFEANVASPPDFSFDSDELPESSHSMQGLEDSFTNGASDDYLPREFIHNGVVFNWLDHPDNFSSYERRDSPLSGNLTPACSSSSDLYCSCSRSSSPISRCDLSFNGSSDKSWETVDVEIVDSDHSLLSEESIQIKKLNDGIRRAKAAWENAIVS